MAELGGALQTTASRASGDADGTVGTGIFINSGEAIRIAGPGGALLAFSIAALTAITSMDGHAEMIALWPIANAKVKFVRCFVDEDLAVVVGIAYWYTYAVGFASTVTTTVALAEYWHPSNAILVAFPLVLGSMCVIALNFLDVKWFGFVACIGGGLVALLVLGAFTLMLCINRGVGSGDVIGATYFNDGVQMDPQVVFSKGAAVCAVIPIAAYAFVGIEIVSAAAIEVQRPQMNLPAAANWIAPVTRESQNALQRKDPDYTPTSGPTIKSVLVIAVEKAGMPNFTGFLMAALIFTTYNTALVALLKKHIHDLKDVEYRTYNLWLKDNKKVKYRSLLEVQNFQPFAAWPIALLLFFAIRKISHRCWKVSGGFVQLEHNWRTLKEVLNTLDEKNIENSPETSRRPTENESTVPSPIQYELSRRNTGANAGPQAVT
ncbi:hypothetical protein G7Y79_00018g044150 [Physcia stellaris]|nr:hypothetical protein G7Y79_00018g044150 [Physcia stellaris]